MSPLILYQNKFCIKIRNYDINLVRIIKFSIKLEITCPANKCVIQPELCAAACPVPFLTRSKLHPALLYLYNHFLSTLPRSCSTSLAYVSNAILVMIFFST